MDEKLAVEQLRTRIRIETDLNDVSLSDELLKCFLQARKNDLNRTFDLFKKYCKMAVKNPNLMAPPPAKNFQLGLSYGNFSVSPIRDEKSGCQIFLLNFYGCDDMDLSAEEGFSCMLKVFQYLVSNAETRRILCVIDTKCITLRHFRKFTPLFGLKIPSLLNNVLPIRFYGVHILNEHPVVKLWTNIIWPFLSSKIRNTVHFHGDSLESLHRHVSPSCLPSEYGGSLGSIDQMNLSKFIADNNIENIFDCLNDQLFPLRH